MLLIVKIAAQCAYPLLIALLLGVIAAILLWRGRRRGGGLLLIAALGWLWLWSTPVFSDWLRATLERRNMPVLVKWIPSADAIVVLGGAVAAEAPPERLYPDLSAAVDRVWHAARLYQAGKAPLVLASGGNLPWSSIDRPEADVMAALLQQLGVPGTAIQQEPRSRTTRENRDNSLPLLRAQGVRSILLVTSALHMPRALALFQATDLKVIPAPTDIEVIHRDNAHPLRWLPDAQALADSTRAFKEYVGRLVDRLLG